MINKIILILFELGYGIKFNLIGEISISEIFLIATSFFYIKKINFRKNKEIGRFTILYTLLIVIQIITEIAIDNNFNSAAKGIAINILSYLHIIFLYTYLKKSRSLISFALLGLILRFIIFGKDIESINIEDSAFIALLKFTLVPILSYSLIFLASTTQKWKTEYIAITLGILLIILGARSGGGIIFMTGLLSYIKRASQQLHFANFKIVLIIASVSIYTSYCFYVNQVLEGKIRSGNSEQLFRAENPYNPINLLMMGRSEVFVGYQAFTDKPWTGWGAWPKDPGMKYHKLQAKINNGKYNIYNILYDEIPSHSVLIGIGMMNGIFALFTMMLIFIYIIYMAKKTLKTNDAYTYVTVAFLIDFIWTMLFSPQSAFRYVVPIEMAFILITYQKYFVFKRIHKKICKKSPLLLQETSKT